MNTLPALLLASALLPAAAHAKAYFAPKTDMISNSAVIAVVDITRVTPTDTTKPFSEHHVKATVKQGIKGETGNDIEFRVPSFFPCAITQVTNGTYLVFLSRGKNGLQGNNWHLSYRPVKDGRIEWYAAGDPYNLEWQPQAEVLRDLRKIIADSAK